MAQNKNFLKSSKEYELYVDCDNIIVLYEMLTQAQSNLNFDSSQFIEKFENNLDLRSCKAKKK
jgi:hypothetical protein